VTTHPWRPVRAVMRELYTGHRRTLQWFWVVVAGSLAVIGLVLGAAGATGTRLWPDYVLTPNKYFLLVLGILAAATQLPIHVAHGLTRRQFAFGATAYFGVVVAASAAATLLTYPLLMAARSVGGGGGPWLTPGSAGSTFGEAVASYAAYTCGGWLLGALFYRLDGWRRVVLLPVGALPALASDFVLGRGQTGVSLDDLLSLGAACHPTAIGLCALLVAAGSYAAFRLVRDVAIRKVTG